LTVISISVSQAGTTGKIVGKVIDKTTGEALPGVNILVEGTTLGAATDLDGNYLILRVPPGIFTIRVNMMGYKELRYDNVKVSIDKTTQLNFELEPTVLEVGETVTIVAERPLVQRDLTSTSTTVGAEVIQNLPVETFQDVINLQAGVVEGHFRGGRSGEVLYMIDGVPINDVYSGDYSVQVENNAIQELEVISGTFNAEYGQAMSGVVNIVTKEGGDTFHGQLSSYIGDYVSFDDEIFWNIKAFNPIYNFETSFSGPVPGTNKKLNFFASGRYYSSEGAIYGRRVFLPSDSSNFPSTSVEDWYIESHGQGFRFSSQEQFQQIADSIKAAAPFVPMRSNSRLTGHLKLAWRLTPSNKMELEALVQQRKFQEYDHSFRFNPDGDFQRHQLAWNSSLSWTKVLSNRTFFTVKAARFFTEHKQYVYPDPYDSRYVNPVLLEAASGNAFRTGGQQMWHFYRNTTTNIGKMDLTSQVTNQHLIKMGLEGRLHRLWLRTFEIRLNRETDWKPYVPPQIKNMLNNDQYLYHPVEFSAYLQDKMEFDYLVVNAGVRFDYFHSDGKIPVNLLEPNVSPVKKASPRQQVSPRLGLAYPITDRGVIHVSYGHFFQIPNFEFLYINPEFELYGTQDFGSTPPPDRQPNTIGNANLEPERTVIYEIGLQQQLGENYALDVTGYFKDIRNLNGTQIHYSITGIRYGRYINRDYGNVKGITFSLERRLTGGFGATVDYTYQVAKGNASDPTAAFLDAEAGREPEKQLVPLDWDRTHSLNFSITAGRPEQYSISLIGRLGSGLPYTPTAQNIRTAVENSERRPFFMTVDLYAYKNFKFMNLQYIYWNMSE
ncbi:MAG: TonB-dependent receptor, partial [candidate division KSB1 bacterium]|nr:TonB-dependent receptor [candidate division KSB1 bacterium]